MYYCLSPHTFRRGGASHHGNPDSVSDRGRSLGFHSIRRWRFWSPSLCVQGDCSWCVCVCVYVCVCVCSVCPLRLTHTTVYTNVLLVFTVHTLVCEHIHHYNLECKGHCCTQWLEQCWIWKYRSMHITLLWKLLLVHFC